MGGTGTIRGLPFFFSGSFFQLFLIISAVLPAVYYALPQIWYVPLIADLLLLFAAMLDFIYSPDPSKIQIERPIPYPLATDKSNDVLLRIANHTRKRISLMIRDDVPAWCRTDEFPHLMTVEPGSGTEFVYKLVPMVRGNGEFGDVHFWVKGPLNLVWRRGQSNARATIKLYPGLALIGKYRMKLWLAASDHMMRPYARKGRGTEFDSLREYVTGDDPRLVHWPATARRARLMVRQNRIERSQTVFIVLDAGRMMTAKVHGRTKFDYSLNSALLLAYAALQLGDNVGMMVIGQEVACFIPPSRLPGQFGRILDTTYALHSKMEEPRFYRALGDVSARLRKRSLILIFTDFIDERASQGLKRYSLGLTPKHLPLIVAMSDTEVTQLANSSPKNKLGLYKQGVACEMLQRREQLIAHLTFLRCMVLDTTPERISAAVLDRYLELRASAR
jgi:uncharacterized protein (DUF58 family)